MKKILTILISTGFAATSFAQNVGIGSASFTPSSDALLELRSTSSGFLMPKMTEAERDAISSPNEGLMIYQTNNTPGYRYYDGSAWIPFGAGAADNFGNHVASQNIVVGEGLGIVDSDEDTKIQVEESSDDDHIRFDVAGAEAMLIDNAQNVGIGSSSPSEKLHVEGNIRIGGGAYLDDDATTGGNSDDWIRLNGYVEMKSNTDNYGLVLRDKDNSEYFGLTQKDGWSYLSDSGASGSYFLRGNGANAEVRGDLNVRGSDVYDDNGDLKLSGEDNVYITMDYNGNDSDNRAIRFGKNNMTSPTELMRLTETGRLGVGDVNPITNVQIYGNATSGFTPGFGGAGPELGFSRGGFYYGVGATIQMIDYNGYSSGLCFNVHRGVNYGGGGSFADNWPNDVVQAMTINNTGQVGIGTAKPSKLLHVAEADGGSIMASREDASTQNGDVLGELLFDSSDDTTPSTVDGSAVVRGVASENHGNSNKGGHLVFMTKQSGTSQNLPATERMRVTHNGNVGIGTNNPTAQLHTTGSVKMGTLAGSGTRMVVASSNGTLSTQAIPGGGGGGSSAYGVNGTGNQSTSSSSFTNISSMALNLTAGTYILQYNSEVKSSNSSNRAQFAFHANGGTVSASTRIFEPDNNEEKTVTMTTVVTVTSTQTVRVRFKRYSGSGSITVGNRCFTAIKL